MASVAVIVNFHPFQARRKRGFLTFPGVKDTDLWAKIGQTHSVYLVFFLFYL